MSEIKRLRGNKIYFPKGTSKWIGIADQQDALKITVTAGGGMGGSRWTRFVKPQTIKDGLNWFEQIYGDSICINTNYIVEVERVTIIRADYTCTNHNFGLKNALCTVEVYTGQNDNVVLVPEYKSMDEWTY